MYSVESDFVICYSVDCYCCVTICDYAAAVAETIPNPTAQIYFVSFVSVFGFLKDLQVNQIIYINKAFDVKRKELFIYHYLDLVDQNIES